MEGSGDRLNVLALMRSDGHKFLFFYDDESAAALLKTLRRLAADEDSSFTWFDAAVLSMRAKIQQAAR